MEELERYIQVLISEDCMECQICLDKPEDNEEIYEVGDIVEFLISKGVVFGIDERKIQKSLKKAYMIHMLLLQ